MSTGEEKYTPALFIGLGGHGGNVVDVIAQKLKRREDWHTLSSLMHFFAIDTDQGDLDRRVGVPESNRFCISNFNKKNYQKTKYGEGKHGNPIDPYFTQWAPHPDEYTFRSEGGAGAGQIRIESRLGIYYNIEREQKGGSIGLTKGIKKAIEEAMRIGNAYASDTKTFRIFIFGSVAGGTGSGGFLPIGFLVKSLIPNAWNPKLTYVLTLPTLFENKVGPNYPDVCANGYAALKELEYLNANLGYQDGKQKIEFHYNPKEKNTHKFVEEKPAVITYLVDTPEAISIERLVHAIADAIYLLAFSPMLSSVKSDMDNYGKHQKIKAAKGIFSTFYGVLGTHVLTFPRRDILDYSSMVHTAKFLKEHLAISGKYTNDDGDIIDFTIDYDDPIFRKKSQEEQNKIIDEAFLQYVKYRFEEEKEQEINGLFTDIAPDPKLNETIYTEDGGELEPDENTNNEQLPEGPIVKDKKRIWDNLYSEFGEWIQQAEDEASRLEQLESYQISQGNPVVGPHLGRLNSSYTQCRKKVNRFKEGIVKDIEGGVFFSRFFKKYKVNPVAQRFFLITLNSITINNELFIGPYWGEERNSSIQRTTPVSLSPAGDNALLLQQWEKELRNEAKQGLLDKIPFFGDPDNQDFKNKRDSIVTQFNDTFVIPAMDALIGEFWKSIEESLRVAAGELLDTFRNIARIADQEVRQLESKASRFQEDPTIDSQSESAQFHIDTEVMRDQDKGERLWHCMYMDLLNEPSFFEIQEIYATITSSFLPIKDGSRMVTPSARQVVQKTKDLLGSQIRDRFEIALEDNDFNLQKAIELEARYIEVRKQARVPGPESIQKDPFAPGSSRKDLKDKIDSIETKDVQMNIEEKLRLVNKECVLYASLDEDLVNDDSVRSEEQFFYASAPDNNSTTELGLKNLIQKNINAKPTARALKDKDKILFYKSRVNMPLYWLSNVTETMAEYYQIQERKNAIAKGQPKWPGYIPTKIEWAWERGDVPIPSLDPLAIIEEKARLQAPLSSSCLQNCISFLDSAYQQ